MHTYIMHVYSRRNVGCPIRDVFSSIITRQMYLLAQKSIGDEANHAALKAFYIMTS